MYLSLCEGGQQYHRQWLNIYRFIFSEIITFISIHWRLQKFIHLFIHRSPILLSTYHHWAALLELFNSFPSSFLQYFISFTSLLSILSPLSFSTFLPFPFLFSFPLSPFHIFHDSLPFCLSLLIFLFSSLFELHVRIRSQSIEMCDDRDV